MPIPDEGTFLLYSHIAPDITAGDYRFTVTQALDASDDDGAVTTEELPVETMQMHVRVRSPRFTLPPDQVLSTYPPATTTGSYGTRLPQVVIKRRTLPWERGLDGAAAVPGVGAEREMPWLALVVVADDEATVHPSLPVDQCAGGVTLEGPREVERGACLEIRQSRVHALFPSQVEVPLLTHARQVDIGDTELMMGDDDGFLAVVIANRLPLAGRDAAGEDVPRRYTACLVNLEEQLHRLRPDGPELDEPSSAGRGRLSEVVTHVLAREDHERALVGLPRTGDPAGGIVPLAVGPGPDDGLVQPVPLDDDPDTDAPLADPELDVTATTYRVAGSGTSAAFVARGGYDASRVRDETTVTAHGATRIDRELVADEVARELVDPTLRFPVLLHWSFTSAGDTDFKTLMEGLDSGLIGSSPAVAPDGPPRESAGRPPLEVVSTGHVGLAHRTRDGDVSRAWYRGPLVSHPQAERATDRLPLAHDADQLRVAIPDGREDLSLASAFEVGRLLALSRPAMVAALLRWRRQAFAAAHDRVVGDLNQRGFGDVVGVLDDQVLAALPGLLRRRIAEVIAAAPEDVLGPPVELSPPGLPPRIDGDPGRVLALGLGLDRDLFRRPPDVLLDDLVRAEIRVGAGLDRDLTTIRDVLHLGLEDAVVRVASDTLGPALELDASIDLGPTVPSVLLPGVRLEDVIVDGRLADGVLDRIRRGRITDRDVIGGGIAGPGSHGGDAPVVGPFGDALDRLLGDEPSTSVHDDSDEDGGDEDDREERR